LPWRVGDQDRVIQSQLDGMVARIIERYSLFGDIGRPDTAELVLRMLVEFWTYHRKDSYHVFALITSPSLEHLPNLGSPQV